MAKSKYIVGSTETIPPGSRKLTTIKGRPIAIFNIDGEYFGIHNRCPHLGGSLCDGILTGLVESSEPGNYSYTRQGEILKCPWHGWEFDIRTGQSYCRPDQVQARQYKIGVEKGGDVVEGPYVAETVPVKVEEDYIVVEM
jgi:nitrite reductase/ring-hydroxylating ferredoxin subunit